MTDKIVVLSTCASEEEARRIAAAVLEKRLAACVNIMPRVRSIYHWKGALEESEEVLMLIKSSRGLFERLRTEIAARHSYEVPEIVATQIVDGGESYLDWLSAELVSPEAQ